jgi:hypothetical protein
VGADKVRGFGYMTEAKKVMKSYKIVINVSDVGGVYTAENIEKAEEIAETICNEIYKQLKCKYRVEVVSVKEV